MQALITIWHAVPKEEALKESGKHYAAIVSNLADAVFTIKEGVITWCNDSVEMLYGYKKEELIGREAGFFYPDSEIPSQFVKEVSRDIKERGVFLSSSSFQKKDGTWVDVEYSVSLLPGSNPPETIAIARDITERNRAQTALMQALAESEQRQEEISALLEGSRAVLENQHFPDAARTISGFCKELIGATTGYVALMEGDGTEREVLFLDSGGLPSAAAPWPHMPIRGLRAEVYRTGRAAYDNGFATGERKVHVPEDHVDFENVLFAPLSLEAKVVGLLGLANKPGGFTDNDARLASAFGELAAIALRNAWAIESLEDSEERFRSVVETAGDAIISIDTDGSTVYWNRAAERIFGHTASEMIGEPVSKIMPEYFRKGHAEGLARIHSTGEKRIIGSTVEMEGLRKDGASFPIELTRATWKSRGSTFFTAIARDITERRKLDELKDEFIGLVSHELRSPLTVVMGAVNTALTELERLSPEEMRQLLEDAASEADVLSHLLGNLLELSRAQADRLVLYFEPMNIRMMIRGVVEKIGRQHAGHTFLVDVPEGIPPLPGDRLRVERILHNLLENAAKYSPQGGEIHVSVKRDGQRLVIGVSDQGIGISLDHQAMLFQPFQRLEDSMSARVKGIGLGLLVCRRLVEAHSGRIWVESEPGKGTTFHFTLPLVQKAS